jgi:hypothetical protein
MGCLGVEKIFINKNAIEEAYVLAFIKALC